MNVDDFRPVCGMCGNQMTSQNSTIAPEQFICDVCAKNLKAKEEQIIELELELSRLKAGRLERTDLDRFVDKLLVELLGATFRSLAIPEDMLTVLRLTIREIRTAVMHAYDSVKDPHPAPTAAENQHYFLTVFTQGFSDCRYHESHARAQAFIDYAVNHYPNVKGKVVEVVEI